MERKKWISGRWVERAGQRRRRYYRLTRKGRQALVEEQETWAQFAAAVNQVLGLKHA